MRGPLRCPVLCSVEDQHHGAKIEDALRLLSHHWLHWWRGFLMHQTQGQREHTVIDY